MREFMVAQKSLNEFVRFNLKTKVKQGQKNHQAAIQDLETKFVHIFNQQYQTNWFTSDGKTYDPPKNLHDKPTIIHNDSDDKADKAEKEEELSSSKPKKSDQPKNSIPSMPTQRKYGRKKFLKVLVSNKTNSVECLALADLGASINLMPYLLYASPSVNTLIPTRMSIRANHTYHYPMGVAENMLGQVGKFVFPVDFVILEMEEDNKVPLILGRLFLHTADAIIRLKSKELNLGVGDDRITSLIDKTMQHSHFNDDTCFRMDVIDEVTEEELDALLNDSEPFQSTPEKINETSLDEEFAEFMAIEVEEIPEQEEEVNDNFEELPLGEQLFSSFGNHIRSLKADEKKRLVSDDAKPIIQRQRRLNPNMKEVVKKEIIKLLDAGIIYPIEDSPWVSHVHCVPKKGGMIIVTNEKNELVPTRTVTGWRRSGSLSRRVEMPLNSIQVGEIFDIWAIDFIGLFPKSHKFEYILIAIDYVSKWAEVEALPTNDARVAPKLISKWYGTFMVKHGFPSGYVELYDKHGGIFIVNGHRLKLYRYEEQLNELPSEEIHFMCEKGKIKAIPFMAPFPKDYCKIIVLQ
ncbi:reverse transcriptase domain-containing protein, partial [Tanacetum coccineum]